MPPINTSTIEGFEAMTAEQKVEALLKLDVPEAVDLSGYVKKDVFDTKAKEAAEYSRQLKEKMTDDEKTAKEAAEAHQKLQDEYNALLKRSTIAEHTAKYIALGYDEQLARATAEALFDGDMEKVFANQQAYNASMEKKIRADLVKQDPRPGGAGGGEEQKAANVELAAKLGKARADSMKDSNDVLKYYTT